MTRRSALAATASLVLIGWQIGHPVRLAAQSIEKSRLKRAVIDLNLAIDPYRRVPSLRESVASTQRSLAWMASETDEWRPTFPDDGRPLRESVERMTDALRRAHAAAKNANKSNRDVTDSEWQLLQAIAGDLADKVEYCRRSGLDSRRRVTVLTKKDGVTVVNGLEVLYLEQFLAVDPTAKPQQFRKFSSPAVDDLVPGRYVIWAREPGATGRAGARKDARIALASSDDPIEVLAP